MLPSAISAFLTALSFPNFKLYPLAWVSLVPLLLAIRNKNKRAAFGRGYLAGFIFNGTVLYWMGTLAYWAGAIGILGQVALVAYLALYWGVFAMAASILERRSRVPLYLTLPFLWVILEFIQSRLFTGFGWTLLGYSQGLLPFENNLIIQWASVGGVFIVSFWIILVNVLVACAIVAFPRGVRIVFAHAGVALAVLVVAYLGGWRLLVSSGGTQAPPAEGSPDTLRVGLVQPALSLYEKWRLEYRDRVLRTHLSLSRRTLKEEPDLIVWPEAAVPILMETNSRARREIARITASRNIYLLTGGLWKKSIEVEASSGSEEKTRRVEQRNSAFLLSPQGEVLDRYDKVHLAPFGEYTPLQEYLPFLGQISFTGEGMSPGEGFRPLEFKNHRLGILICFETVFPEISREVKRNGADVLVAMTNLAWFGASGVREQELSISIFRSVENRLSMIRCANSGISCFIDPWGRVSGRIGGRSATIGFSPGVTTGDVRTEAISSFYSRHGDIFIWACGIWLVLIIVWGAAFRGRSGTAK